MRRGGSAARRTPRSSAHLRALRRGALLAPLLLALAGSLAASEIRFRDAAAAWGLDFRHHNGASGRRYMVETMVGGLVIFDYDGDGDEDVFFVDAGPLPGYAGEPARSRLYRNEGGGRFADVTDRAGIVVAGYGAGAVAGDVDGDGDLDLYVTGLGSNQLFRNAGDGRFHDVTKTAGVGNDEWTAGAAFADTDGDGDLDLYVASYSDFTVATHRDCVDQPTGIVAYCKPRTYAGLPHRFYRNGGDGTFSEAAAAVGLLAPPAHGLGASFFDFDLDGWQDLYVANDGDPSYLFHNRGDGTFEEIAMLAGAALSPNAKPEAGMGIDLDDYDGDGRADIVKTNFEIEGLALYRNVGDGLFHDDRFVAKLAEPSLLFLGFGIDFADFDHDGDLDLAVANGHVNDIAAKLREGAKFEQRNQVYENRGNGTFLEALDTGMDLVRVSRGLATGDLDTDGDLDVVVLDTNDLAEVWENRSRAGALGGFLLVDLVDEGGPASAPAPRGNAFAVGARVVATVAGRELAREVRTGTSYLSQNAMSLHYGTGRAERVERLSVRWPDGRRQAWAGLPVDRRLRLVAPR